MNRYVVTRMDIHGRPRMCAALCDSRNKLIDVRLSDCARKIFLSVYIFNCPPDRRFCMNRINYTIIITQLSPSHNTKFLAAGATVNKVLTLVLPARQLGKI